MKEKIKEEVSLAICLAMLELIEINKITEDDVPSSGLIKSSLNVAFSQCMRRYSGGLNQEGLNIIGAKMETGSPPNMGE